MTVKEAVESGDLDRLVRLVDRLCGSRDWNGVVELRDRCRHAIERGLQLWPAAEFAEYRLALEAPGAFAGPVLVTGAGRFALGPLWEVAASRHEWSELTDHVPPGPARALCAHERVIRGEDLTDDDSIDLGILELPAVLAPWEAYAAAEYQAAEAAFPTPDRPEAQRIELDPPGESVADEDAVEALAALAAPWSEQSNGVVATAALAGTAESAIAAHGLAEAMVTVVDPATAMAWMAWTGASGGAYGRRRGTPMGRFGAWWAGSMIAGIEWPPDPDDFIVHLGQVRWLLWEPVDETPGWSGSIAAERDGRAWALMAHDRFREQDAPS